MFRANIVHYAALFLAAAAFCFGYGGLPWAAALAVAVHELGHYLAAKALGIKIHNIELEPGGVRLDTGMRCLPLWLEAAFLLAGAFANAVTAFVWRGFGLWGAGEVWTANMVLCAVNLLPAIPLDGGRLLYEAVVRRAGICTARAAVGICGAGIGMFILILGAYMLYITRYNFTLALFGALILVYSKVNQGVGCLAEAQLRQGMWRGNVLCRARIYTAGASMEAVEIAKQLPAGAVIAVVDSDGGIQGFITLAQVCRAIVEIGYTANLGDVLDNKWHLSGGRHII